MSAITKLLRILRRTDIDIPAETEAIEIDRREFLEKMLYGGAVISTTWLMTDKLYEEYGGTFEEEWLKAYYKSDFVGV